MSILFLLPLIAALIGWFTNFLAVKMLFHPRKPVKIGFFKLQGIFPKRQGVIAEKLGKMVSEELFSFDDIREIIEDPENLANVNEHLDAKIDDFMEKKFPEKYPLMSMFIGPKTKKEIKDTLTTEVENMIPEFIEKNVSKLEARLDIQKIVEEKIYQFPPEKLEQIIMDVLKSEFRFIELIGAILGFVIGLLQVGLLQLGS